VKKPSFVLRKTPEFVLASDHLNGSYKFVHIVLDLGAVARHNKAKFVQNVPELKSQEPLVI